MHPRRTRIVSAEPATEHHSCQRSAVPVRYVGLKGSRRKCPVLTIARRSRDSVEMKRHLLIDGMFQNGAQRLCAIDRGTVRDARRHLCRASAPAHSRAATAAPLLRRHASGDTSKWPDERHEVAPFHDELDLSTNLHSASRSLCRARKTIRTREAGKSAGPHHASIAARQHTACAVDRNF